MSAYRWTRRSLVKYAGLSASSGTLGWLLHARPTVAANSGGGKTVTMGMWQQVDTLNTLMTAETGNVVSASRLVLRGLLFLDEQANWIGELATDVPSPSNGGVSSNGTTITYKLRKGITWSDGKPAASADVKFTWETIMTPDSGVVSRYGYDQIQSIDTPDDQTAVLHFKQPFAPWPILFDVVLPQHILAKETNLAQSSFNQLPVGFGPFKITENVKGDHMTFEAYDGYWKGRPKIDRLFIRYFGDTNAMVEALKAKDVDLTWGTPISSVPELQKMGAQGITTLVVPAPNPEQYAFNRDATQVPLFADQELRRALSLAVDRKTIVAKLLNGLAPLAINDYDQSPWQRKDLSPVAYDPAESKKILDGLGWKPGSDGIRVKDGKRLSFKFTVTSGNQLRENVQLLVQQNFKDVGAEAVIKNAPSDTVFGSWAAGGVLARGNYELAGFSYPLTNPDPDLSVRYLCNQRPSDSNPTGAQRYRYCNPQIDALWAKQAQQTNPDQRRATIDQIQQMLYSEYNQIFLYDSPQAWGVLTRVKNFKVTPFVGFEFNPQEWDVA